MKRHHVFSIKMLAAAMTCAALGVFARDPQSSSLRSTLIPIVVSPVVGSLTPPPKEWAMFPQDDPPPQAPNAGQPRANGAPGANGSYSSGGYATGGVVSAPNLRSQAPAREMPLLWMLVTAALSLGAIVACGGLILQKDAPEVIADETPVVSEELEVKA